MELIDTISSTWFVGIITTSLTKEITEKSFHKCISCPTDKGEATHGYYCDDHIITDNEQYLALGSAQFKLLLLFCFFTTLIVLQ